MRPILLLGTHCAFWPFRRQIQDILGHYEKKSILEDINLVLKPGRTYLVMGPPGW